MRISGTYPACPPIYLSYLFPDVIAVKGQPNTAVSLKVQSSKVPVPHDVTQGLTTPVLDKNCTVPDDWLYPLCAYKVTVMKIVLVGH